MIIEPKKVKTVINEKLYQYNILPARKGGRISSALFSKAAGLISVFGLTKNIDNLHSCIEKFLDNETMDSLYELVFADECKLSCDGKLVVDPDIHFQGKYLEMMKLIFHAVRSNCDDFFTLVGGLLKQNTNLSEILKNLQESKETPEQIKNLLQNFLSIENE